MAKYSKKIGVIPNDWEFINAKDCLFLESGMRPKEYVTDIDTDIPSLGGENIDESGCLIFENIRYIDSSYYKKMKKGHIHDEDIYINKDGANTGKVAFCKIKPFKECAVNEHVFLIRNDGTFKQQYLFYCLLSNLGKQQILKKIIGSAQEGINNSFTKGIILPKPSLPEQASIANILSSVDEAIDSVKKSIEAAEKLKKSLMQNLLTGRMKPDGTFRTEEEFYEDEKFGKVPIGWYWGRMSEIAEIIAGQSPQGEYYNEDRLGYPMLNGPTEFTDEYPVPVQWTTKVTKLCRKGDILFTVRGSSTGKMNFADQEYCIGRGLAAIRPKYSSNIQFIYYTLLKISEMILAEARGAGTTFPNVSRGDLMKKVILIPNNQNEIIQPIFEIGSFIKSKQTQITTLERLKKSLMQNLLTGKVRVGDGKGKKGESKK